MSGQGQYYQPQPQQTQPQPQQYQPQPLPQYPMPQQTQYHLHADIVHRFVAIIIDAIILGIFWVIIGVAIAFAIIADDGNFHTFDTFGWSLWAFAIGALMFLIALLYFSFMEGGSGNATIGKKLMRLRVVDTNYQPCGLSKAFIRNLCRFSFLPFISWVVAILDIILILVREDRQRLGDIVANTYVIEDRPMGPQQYYPPPPQQPQYYQQQPPPQQYQQYPQQQQQQPPQHHP
jgi:uncharacterized RDD family membrane protein YckC